MKDNMRHLLIFMIILKISCGMKCVADIVYKDDERSCAMAPKIMILVLVASFSVISGCATTATGSSIDTCRIQSKRAPVNYFGVDESAYEHEVVEQYWQKKNWGGLPVSERKDLMSDMEDMAEDQYRSVRWVEYYRCMDERGFVLTKNEYQTKIWRKKSQVSDEERVEVPERPDFECLIDRECDNGFSCDVDRHICSQDKRFVPVVAAGCTKDTDCKGDRICEEGVCVNPLTTDPDPESEESSDNQSSQIPQSP